MTSMKRRLRMGHGEEEDRISKLPDEILIHIISSLDTNHAIRTGALSTRWKKLWYYVPHLVFDLADVDYSPNGKRRSHKHLNQLMSFIARRKRAVSVSRPPTPRCVIRKFSLNYDHYEPDTVDNFAFMLVVRSIIYAFLQELCLELPTSSLCKEFRKVFACQTLVHLKLVEQGRDRRSGFHGTPYLYLPEDQSANLPNLKTLHLCVYQITIEVATKLFSSCPKLESLTLLACYFRPTVLTFKIIAPNLKRLVFGIDPPRDETHYHNVVIKAPLLETLHISGILGTYLFANSCSSSLVEARLDLLEDINQYRLTGSWLLHILNEVSSVKSLQITRPLSTTLDHCNRDASLVFPNLTRLEVKGIRKSLAIGLLKLTPNLQYLKLSDHGLESDSEDAYNDAPGCLLSCMTVIEVEESSGWRSRLRLMEYFLKNCKVLKKMIIDCVRVAIGDSNESFENDIYEEIRNLQTEISRLLRGSKTCQVEFICPGQATIFT